MELNFIRMDWSVMGQTYSGTWSADKEQIIDKLNQVVAQIVIGWLLKAAFSDEDPSFPLPDLIYGFYDDGIGKGTSDPTWY